MTVIICAVIKTEGSEVPQNQTLGYLNTQIHTQSLIILQTKYCCALLLDHGIWNLHHVKECFWNFPAPLIHSGAK